MFPDGQMAQLNVSDPQVSGYRRFSRPVLKAPLGIAARMGCAVAAETRMAVRTMLVSFSSIEDAIQSVTDIISDTRRFCPPRSKRWTKPRSRQWRRFQMPATRRTRRRCC